MSKYAGLVERLRRVSYRESGYYNKDGPEAATAIIDADVLDIVQQSAQAALA